MSQSSSNDLSNFSMLELFQLEVESQRTILTDNLLALERNPTDAARLESLMRAAHSLKGAARMVNLQAAVDVAHEMEETFVRAQRGTLLLGQTEVDLLLRCVDLLHRIAQTPETDVEKWSGENLAEVQSFVADLTGLGNGAPSAAESLPSPSLPVEQNSTVAAKDDSQRFLRVTAANLNRLLGLASESLVESRWLNPFAQSLSR